MSQNAKNISDSNISQWVTFKLGDETYGIRVMQVQEVVRMPEIAPVPGSPAYVLGIINLRGNVVTVLDIRRRFGLDDKEADDATRIVIVEAQQHIIGILVDNVAEVVELSSSQIETAPNVGNDKSSKYIEGVFSRENDLLILVDVSKLLSDSEWQEVADI
ncbi:MAG TPA: purine-binding chemotaxis protein CheW [Acidiferrobacteraceae bacterium]|nr:purine-binding chemotaxis protein CheW [Acidiferrobacteraceae bacterium]